MILRSVIKHVRNQEWTAIALDFLIVVLGVFVGLQVSNWNQARLTNAAAADFNTRLLADLEREALTYDAVQTYYRDVLEAAETTYAALTEVHDISNEQLLVNAFRATQYNSFERYRSTYDELVSSGNLNLIRDPQLKATISGYYAIDFVNDIGEEGLRSEYRGAFRKLMTPDIQLALSDQCGDREVGDKKYGQLSIGFECAFEWPSEKIVSAANKLRSADGLPPLLSVRIVELHGNDDILDFNREFFGIDTFNQTESTE